MGASDEEKGDGVGERMTDEKKERNLQKCENCTRVTASTKQ